MASSVVPRRGVSSIVTPFTGVISRSNRPSSIARKARSFELSANCSRSWRDSPHFSAIISAELNCVTSPSPNLFTQPVEPVKGSPKPYACPASIAADIGICDIACTPPATTTSAVPLITACAAKWTDCCEDPHCRSIVTPGTCNGRPADSQQVRAISPARGPIVSTLPKMTSS